MTKASVEKYQSVSVYNFLRGEVADTYAVPMPPKVVVTTGAMAQFARKGEIAKLNRKIIPEQFTLSPSKERVIFFRA